MSCIFFILSEMQWRNHQFYWRGKKLEDPVKREESGLHVIGKWVGQDPGNQVSVWIWILGVLWTPGYFLVVGGTCYSERERAMGRGGKSCPGSQETKDRIWLEVFWRLSWQESWDLSAAVTIIPALNLCQYGFPPRIATAPSFTWAG